MSMDPQKTYTPLGVSSFFLVFPVSSPVLKNTAKKLSRSRAITVNMWAAEAASLGPFTGRSPDVGFWCMKQTTNYTLVN